LGGGGWLGGTGLDLGLGRGLVAFLLAAEFTVGVTFIDKSLKQRAKRRIIKFMKK
jgi:hypothetical protein